MRIDELIVEVRDASLERVGQILPADLVGFKAVLRFNNVGSWEIDLPEGHPVGSILKEPGSGLIVTGPNGVILSGPTTSATNSKTPDDPEGVWSIRGVDDSVILGERLAYPYPASADVAEQIQAYDIRTGQASTIIYEYVDYNIGPMAPLEREVPGLAMAIDPLVGSTVYGSARFDILGELISGLASIDGLGFDIKQTDGTLEFRVFQPVDRSAYIRMDVKNNTLAKTEYSYGAHSLSRAIVAGQGTETDRTFIEVTSTESLAAETLWGRRIETFIDERNTDDSNELEQAGVEALAEGGITLTSIDVVPSSDLTMAYGKDWDLGDLVTVDVGGQEVSALVTTVSMSIGEDGVRVGATVGNPTGVDYEALVTKKQTSTASRVTALERKESGAGGGGDSYLHLIRAYNKGSITGGTLPKGSVVMFAGSQGDQIDVALAVADGTYPEYYLAGIIPDVILADTAGDVVQLGVVDRLDTSAFSLGDILYADPVTPGGLSLTPGAWATPIAAVTRVHATTGRILVRCIPGGAGGGADIVVSDTAPDSPEPGTSWFNSDTGVLYISYEDADSQQWVQVNNGIIADAELTARVTSLEGVRPVSIGGTGASSFTSGGYLKGNGTSAVSAQTGIPAGDVTSGTLSVDIGGTGATTGAGLVPVFPTGITVSSGSSSVASDGTITLTSATAAYINGIFTSSFTNYKILFMARSSVDAPALYMRLNINGTDTSTGYFYSGSWQRPTNSTYLSWNGNNTGFWDLGRLRNSSSILFGGQMDLFQPQSSSVNSKMTYSSWSEDTSSGIGLSISGLLNNTSQFNGFTLFPSAGNLSGTFKVYGYR